MKSAGAVCVRVYLGLKILNHRFKFLTKNDMSKAILQKTFLEWIGFDINLTYCCGFAFRVFFIPTDKHFEYSGTTFKNIRPIAIMLKEHASFASGLCDQIKKGNMVA